MRIPDSLASLAEFGAIEDVVRPLMSGKEAHVYLVIAGGRECIAKVYKQAEARAFRNRVEYTEGRSSRNTRDQRAMGKRTRHGRSQDEAAWQSAEVDMIYRLRAAGVRVPTPYRYMDGVLLMELITDADGDPAPRLGDLQLDAASATAIYDTLIREVKRMLCAGIVHGDLSDFNVLMSADGPVIIDLPQAIDAARNPNARKILVRDVDNLHRFLLRHAPGAKIARLAEEMWELYETNALTPDTPLMGTWRGSDRRADTGLVLDQIADAEYDERQRRQRLGLGAEGAGRRRRSGRGGGGGGGVQRPRDPQRVPPEPPRAKAGDPGTRQSVAAMIRAAEEAALRPKLRAESKPAERPPERREKGPPQRRESAPQQPPPGPAPAPAGTGKRRRRRRRPHPPR